MAGTREGGLKAKAKNLARDPDFYKTIGTKGGKIGTTGGFADGEEGLARARIAGAKGGRISRRYKKPPVIEVIEHKNKYQTFVDKLRGKKSV